jgi:hypothetical protein
VGSIPTHLVQMRADGNCQVLTRSSRACPCFDLL